MLLLTWPYPAENCPLPSLERLQRGDLSLWTAVRRRIKTDQIHGNLMNDSITPLVLLINVVILLQNLFFGKIVDLS